MIISEKQILELISIAYAYQQQAKDSGLVYTEYGIKYMERLDKFLKEINSQQSEELKEIK